MEKMVEYWFTKVFKFMFFALVAGTVMGFGVMILWNALLPSILGVTTITFWQALGLLLLSRVLFGNMNGSGGGRGNHRKKWKKRWEKKWNNMSEEDRAEMKARWGDKCGKSRGFSRKKEEKAAKDMASAEAQSEVDPTWMGKPGPDEAFS